MALAETNPTRCLVCHGESIRQRYAITRFCVMQCLDCDQVFLDPLPSEDEIRDLFKQLYTNGEGSVPELKEYYTYTYEDAPDNPLVQQYEEWLDKIEAVRGPGRVLDVGCGTGLFLSVARRRGWEPYGIDESVEATDHARNHFGLTPWLGAFEDFAGGGEQFDLITAWDVIEHARDPVALLKCMQRSLSADGIVALSTPNQHSMLDLVAGWMYRLSARRLTWPLEKFYIEQHFLYFTPRTLQRCLARADLKVAQLDLEQTQLERLSLSPAMRLALNAMFLAGRVLHRENRLFAIARTR